MKKPDRELRAKYGGVHDPELDDFDGLLSLKWVSTDPGSKPLTHIYHVKDSSGRIDFTLKG